MTEDSYIEALKRLGGEGARVVSNDVALSASRLADALASFPRTVARGEEALQRFDEELARVLALAIVARWSWTRGRPSHGLACARHARRRRDRDTARPHGRGDGRARPCGACSDTRRPSLESTGSRGATGETRALRRRWRRGECPSRHQAAAARCLRARRPRQLPRHVAWFSSRRWRASVGPLSTDGQVQLVFAKRTRSPACSLSARDATATCTPRN